MLLFSRKKIAHYIFPIPMRLIRSENYKKFQKKKKKKPSPSSPSIVKK